MATATIEEGLLIEAIDTLERIGCQFDMCDGPTLEPVNMSTCYACATLARLRVAAGRQPRREDEMTAAESIHYRDQLYMATTRGQSGAVLEQVQVGDRVTYMGGKTVWEVLRIETLDGGWARVAPADEDDDRDLQWFAIEHLTVVAP